jgi:hypothetical protein
MLKIILKCARVADRLINGCLFVISYLLNVILGRSNDKMSVFTKKEDEIFVKAIEDYEEILVIPKIRLNLGAKIWREL